MELSGIFFWYGWMQVSWTYFWYWTDAAFRYLFLVLDGCNFPGSVPGTYECTFWDIWHLIDVTFPDFFLVLNGCNLQGSVYGTGWM